MDVSLDVQIPGQPVGKIYARELRMVVAKLVNIVPDKFPGAQPVSFVSGHLKELEKENYFVCEKTDGLRAVLFLCYNKLLTKYEAFFIDRKNQYHYVDDLKFPTPESSKTGYQKFHSDTLIDGELVVDREPDGGKSMLSRPLTKRLGYFSEFILNPLMRMKRERPELYAKVPFTIERKAMELSYAIEKVFNDIPQLKHKNDGLIFTSSEAHYTPGSDPKILKWKPAEENSVDFKLRTTANADGPVSMLQLWRGGQVHKDHGILFVDETTFNSFASQEIIDGRIIECRWNPQYPNYWQFMRFRDDKDTANHYTIYEKIMQSVADGITRQELLQSAPRIREQWKTREKTLQPTTSDVAAAPLSSNGIHQNSIIHPTVISSSNTIVPAIIPVSHPPTIIATVDHGQNEESDETHAVVKCEEDIESTAERKERLVT